MCIFCICILPYLCTMQYFHIAQGLEQWGKGGTTSERDWDWLLTACFVTLPPMGIAQCTEYRQREVLSVQSNQLGRIRITEACATRSSIFCRATAREELLKLHNTTSVNVLRKWADNIKEDLAPYFIAERILIPQLYGLSKYPLYRHALKKTVLSCWTPTLDLQLLFTPPPIAWRLNLLPTAVATTSHCNDTECVQWTQPHSYPSYIASWMPAYPGISHL